MKAMPVGEVARIESIMTDGNAMKARG